MFVILLVAICGLTKATRMSEAMYNNQNFEVPIQRHLIYTPWRDDDGNPHPTQPDYRQGVFGSVDEEVFDWCKDVNTTWPPGTPYRTGYFNKVILHQRFNETHVEWRCCVHGPCPEGHQPELCSEPGGVIKCSGCPPGTYTRGQDFVYEPNDRREVSRRLYVEYISYGCQYSSCERSSDDEK